LWLLGIVPGLASPPPEGIAFEHGDWMLACDNTRTCRAAGYQKEAGDTLPVSILLTRLAGPRQTVTGELMLGQYDEASGPHGLRCRSTTPNWDRWDTTRTKAWRCSRQHRSVLCSPH
jgi:hypothetical protein